MNVVWQPSSFSGMLTPACRRMSERLWVGTTFTSKPLRRRYTAERGRLIAKLKNAEPGTRERALYDEFEATKRTAEASSAFARLEAEDGGRFPLTGRGDINTYALFAELFASLASKRGRAGVIVPDSTDFREKSFFGETGLQRTGVRWIDQEGSEWTPLYEGKMFHYFNHRHGTYENFRIKAGKLVKEVPPPSPDQLCDPEYEVEPRYWIEARLFQDWCSNNALGRLWFIGWRNVTGPTLVRTCIASALPSVALGHSTPLLWSGLETRYSAVLLGLITSMTFDYLVRLKLGGANLTYSYLRQIAAPPPSAYRPADLAFIVPRVLELTYTSHSMAPFARDLGYDGPPFAWDEDRRAQLRAELDAWYARAYGLSRDELRYILDPADVKGADYPSETFRVLKKNEIARFGEYRTARLVLAAWGRLERGELAA